MEAFMKQLAIGVTLALIGSSVQAIVIDNGIPIGSIGHVSADVSTGGAVSDVVYTMSRDPSVFNTNDVLTENVVNTYRTFVDPGIKRRGFELIGSEPARDPFNSNSITSFGSFVGENGNTIRWFAYTRTDPRREYVASVIVFDTAGSTIPIGSLRVYQYLDGDIQGPDDDVILIRDTTPILLGVRNGTRGIGIAQSGTPTGSATFVGSIADIFDQIPQRIMGFGQPVSIPTMVINLATIDDSTAFVFDTYHGPGNVGSALAWDINPESVGARIDHLLTPISPSRTPESECGAIVDDGGSCEGPIVPVNRQFTCRGTKCKVEIACNQATECVSEVNIVVTPPAPRLTNRTTAPPVQRPVRFAAAVANIPPNSTAIVKPKLTKRGKIIFRANRRKRITGVMQILNSGALVTSVPVRIKLK